MATLHLLASVADEKGWALSAVTVDHGLRAESAAEAEFVAAACAKIGVSHETLKWNRSQSTGNLQDQARRGRYGLIARWAQGRRITHIALGHTADDQAETFLMNLARGSGIDGLAGMRHRWSDDGITWTRPFLLQDRADLRAWLSRRGIAWVDDPSNEDTAYQRVKGAQGAGCAGAVGDRCAGFVRSDCESGVGASGAGPSDARDCAADCAGGRGRCGDRPARPTNRPVRGAVVAC